MNDAGGLLDLRSAPNRRTTKLHDYHEK
jgi:hypothetical protein